MRAQIFLLAALAIVTQCRWRNRDAAGLQAGQSVPELEVPILCYHNIRAELDHHSPELTVTDGTFAAQMKFLHDSGYHTILPDELYDHLTHGTQLPPKPIMLTFDDSHEEHFTIASREMNKFGFKGVFFVMTIAIDKPHYLSRTEIKELSDEGNTIACHTYDHPSLTRLPADQWSREIDEPRKLLEQITGKPVNYFAYPYGSWNETAIEQLTKRGIKAAFQLSQEQDPRYPLYTIRRVMVSDTWSLAKLEKEIHTAFNKKYLAYSK